MDEHVDEQITLPLEALASFEGRDDSLVSLESTDGKTTRACWQELGLTQEDLADKASIHRTYRSDVERGTRNVSLINIERLASGLTISLSELFRIVERS
jgi:DNA-binding XRE family transcriptional regulator